MTGIGAMACGHRTFDAPFVALGSSVSSDESPCQQYGNLFQQASYNILLLNYNWDTKVHNLNSCHSNISLKCVIWNYKS